MHRQLERRIFAIPRRPVSASGPLVLAEVRDLLGGLQRLAVGEIIFEVKSVI